jgi:hypothetical protein
VAQRQLASGEESVNSSLASLLRETLLQWQWQEVDAIDEEGGAGQKLVAKDGVFHFGDVKVGETNTHEGATASFQRVQGASGQCLACALFSEEVEISRLPGCAMEFRAHQHHGGTLADEADALAGLCLLTDQEIKIFSLEKMPGRRTRTRIDDFEIFTQTTTHDIRAMLVVIYH